MKNVMHAAIAAVAMSGAAMAAPVDVTGTPVGDSFTSFAVSGPGVHGLEVRGGRNDLRGDWELGLGSATSQSGSFVQAQWAWDDSSLDIGQFAFSYIYSSGTTTFSIWDAAGTMPTTPTLSWNGLSNGNAVEIFAKRDAAINITEFDGHTVDITLGNVNDSTSQAAVYQSVDFSDGFTLAGTLDVKNAQGSRQGIIVKAGNVTVAPIPLPAAASLLLAGLGGLIVVKRQKRSVA